MAVDLLAKRDILETIIPSGAAATTKAAGVSGAWSTYSQIITAANLATLCPGGFILCGAYVQEYFACKASDGGQVAQWNLQVATGASTFEVPIAEGSNTLVASPSDATGDVALLGGRTLFFEPVLIPASTRLAYRATTTSARAVLFGLYLFGYDARYFAQPLRAVDELRYIRGLSSLAVGTLTYPSPGVTNVTTAGSNWGGNYGAAVQFIASAASPLLVVGMSGGSSAGHSMQAQIGIGAAGSEQWMSMVGLPDYIAAVGSVFDSYLARPLYAKTGEAVSVRVTGIANHTTGVSLKVLALK
jgi:hypothetical protein